MYLLVWHLDLSYIKKVKSDAEHSDNVFSTEQGGTRFLHRFQHVSFTKLMTILANCLVNIGNVMILSVRCIIKGLCYLNFFKGKIEQTPRFKRYKWRRSLN